jgi:hypothetical protein
MAREAQSADNFEKELDFRSSDGVEVSPALVLGRRAGDCRSD